MCDRTTDSRANQEPNIGPSPFFEIGTDTSKSVCQKSEHHPSTQQTSVNQSRSVPSTLRNPRHATASHRPQDSHHRCHSYSDLLLSDRQRDRSKREEHNLQYRRLHLLRDTLSSATKEYTISQDRFLCHPPPTILIHDPYQGRNITTFIFSTVRAQYRQKVILIPTIYHLTSTSKDD
jgi:hypothetical protein